MIENSVLDISEEVENARAENTPIVCLESTVFSKLGLPSPANAEALTRCLSVIRDHGVVPAVTAVIDGRLRLGLKDSELERILDCEEKIAVRDLSSAVARKYPVGVTTVSASLAIVNAAGEKVFCTGGIGGVHRGASETFDISADLYALSRFNVLCVSAGAKVFLDLPKTIEVLESLGVPVLGWNTNTFPAFYLRDSGLPISEVTTASEVIQVLAATSSLGLDHGVLLNVPIPEEAALDSEVIHELIRSSIIELEDKGITGQGVTPFILERLAKETEGASVPANMALLENNASVACTIAKLL